MNALSEKQTSVLTSRMGYSLRAILECEEYDARRAKADGRRKKVVWEKLSNEAKRILFLLEKGKTSGIINEIASLNCRISFSCEKYRDSLAYSEGVALFDQYVHMKNTLERLPEIGRLPDFR